MKTTSKKLQELLVKQDNNKNSKLVEFFKKASKKGILEKSEYSLPLIDTIGRNLYKLRK